MTKVKFIKEIGKGSALKKVKGVGTIERAIKAKKPIIINTLNDAKILIGKIIYDLQINKIEENRAKTICYALTVCIQIYNACDYEKRLCELEKFVEAGQYNQAI